MTGVDIGNPMLGAPWQNRPSLIACWEHATYGQDLSGSLVPGLAITMEAISTPQVPVCIPRACRLTRICVHYYYFTTDVVGDFFQLNITRSQDCNQSGGTTLSVDIPIGTGEFTPNCYCVDVNIVFDECDLWYASLVMALGGGVQFPLFRIQFHFELR